MIEASIVEVAQSPLVRALISDYLERYILDGGTTIKIVCGEKHQRDAFTRELLLSACKRSYLTCALDSAQCRVHLVQELFFAVARSIPWQEIAGRFVRRVLTSAGLELSEIEPITLPSLREKYGLSARELEERFGEALRKMVIRHPNYTRTFKSVILALARTALESDDRWRVVEQDVIGWTCGEKGDRMVLKEVGLTRRITRHNARALLADLARWIRAAGFAGLAITLDVSSYSTVVVPEGSRKYSTAAAMDLFEVMRQFIDASDDTVGLFFAFVTSRKFLEDQKRGVSAYPALKMRVLDDVYDSDRPNLLAPLLVIGG